VRIQNRLSEDPEPPSIPARFSAPRVLQQFCSKSPRAGRSRSRPSVRSLSIWFAASVARECLRSWNRRLAKPAREAERCFRAEREVTKLTGP